MKFVERLSSPDPEDQEQKIAGFDVLNWDGKMIGQIDVDADGRLYLYPKDGQKMLAVLVGEPETFDTPVSGIVLEEN